MQKPIAQYQPDQTQINNPHKAMKMVKNDRMAGYVPSYNTPSKTSHISSFKAQEPSYDIHMASIEDDFSFKDVLDMVNPLHHIPLVNIAYREITGDQIKPIGKIIGGGVFSGPIGVAGGLVNAIIEEETGDDLAGNALSIAGVKEKKQATHHEHYQQKVYEDLPIALLAFAETPLPEVKDNKSPDNSNRNYQMVEISEGRTAGSIPRYA